MKMNIKTISVFTLTAVLTATNCKQQKKEPIENAETEELSQSVKASKITLEKLKGSPEYRDAALILDAPETITIAEAGEIDFTFKVENYELKAQTTGANAELLANSGKGQHIHFILDNQPYSAHYEPIFKKGIPAGTHHLVAFLSRSYHESVKNENSVVVRKLEVGDHAQDSLELEMTAPTLIYSRPKGEYSGKDTENVLLDFFVLNTVLAPSGNKIRATISDTEFLIAEWAPHLIKGLPMGEVTIRLELIDAQGNNIPGPFNDVTRTVTLKP